MEEDEIEDIFDYFESFYGIPIDRSKIVITELKVGNYIEITRHITGNKGDMPFSISETTVITDPVKKEIYDLQNKLKKALDKEDYLEVQSIKNILKQNYNIQ